jgi:hypothetical protein
VRALLDRVSTHPSLFRVCLVESGILKNLILSVSQEKLWQADSCRKVENCLDETTVKYEFYKKLNCKY